MQRTSFWAKTRTSYYRQNCWPVAFLYKIEQSFFFSQQNIFAICIFDLKIFCVKFFNHQYFILHKILVLYGLNAFSSKIKTSFFFSYKISFLFVSGTSKYAMYKFLSRNYDIWFQTKFMVRIAWWCFHPILNWDFFFHKISLLFYLGLLNMLYTSFRAKSLIFYFVQNSWPNLWYFISYKILIQWHFPPKLNEFIFVQNLFDICIWDF